ncbi:hypothetical protein AB2B46_19785 [Kluyvera intermedia]|uniref:hypothetical protein n=1 Tax=Kluyvera intermedia TaxID=61648 RepID=UPI0034A2B6A9
MAAFVVFVRRVSPAALRLAGLQRCAKSWATNMHERGPAKRSAAGLQRCAKSWATNMHERGPAKRSAAGAIADYCQP